jgi:hypothetical protein
MNGKTLPFPNTPPAENSADSQWINERKESK